MMKIVEMFRREVDKQVGADATFEQRQEAAVSFAADLMANLLYEAEEEDQAEGPTEVTHVPQREDPKGGPQQHHPAPDRDPAG